MDKRYWQIDSIIILSFDEIPIDFYVLKLKPSKEFLIQGLSYA